MAYFLAGIMREDWSVDATHIAIAIAIGKQYVITK